MTSNDRLRDRVRSDYPYFLEYRTRWSDNDMYNHMNNSVYNFLYDSIINTFLINRCGLDPPTSPQYGVVVYSQNHYFSSVAFPAVVELGLRVRHLGKSSVRYELALFEKDVDGVKSVGEFVHVFVDRRTGKPDASGMSTTLREGLGTLYTQAPVSKI